MSPDRADAIPLLRELLRGDPEIRIIIDRRVSARRSNDVVIEVEPPEDERRADERRRSSPFYYLL